MLEIPRSLLHAASSPLRLLVVGVGNAGVSLVDRLVLAGLDRSLDLLAVNTDTVSLGGSVASGKLLIGSKTARGLGTGGDPEVGAESAEESQPELATALEGAAIVIVCAGLGGGVGSGAGPAIVDLARKQGALVVVLATMPFSFEGRRRVQQAEAARETLARMADAFIIFENDRMADLAEPLAGVHETFAASDQFLAETIIAIARLTLTDGPIRVTPTDLIAVFRQPGASSHFGFGEATGGNRSHEAVERALKSPLLARGKLLADARAVLVHLTAPADLSLAEIRAVMETVGRHTDGQLLLGIGIDPERTALTVALLATAGGTLPKRPARPVVERREPIPAAPAPADPPVEEPEAEDPDAPTTPASELFDTAPYTVAKTTTPRRTAKPEQKTLSLDPIARGRFEKSEPTIVGGEDLDVPTFIRQKIKLR